MAAMMRLLPARTAPPKPWLRCAPNSNCGCSLVPNSRAPAFRRSPASGQSRGQHVTTHRKSRKSVFVCNASPGDDKGDAPKPEKQDELPPKGNDPLDNPQPIQGDEKKDDSGLNSLGFPNFKVVPIWKKEDGNQIIRLQKSEIETLRNQIFGFDSFFVTDEEAYGNGVLFRGNLRGDAEKVFSKLQNKLNEKFSDKYELYLLENPENDKPIAVVFPREDSGSSPPPVPEWLTASAFAFFTLLCLFFGNSINAGLQFLNTSEISLDYFLEQLPQAAIIVIALFIHEFAHFYIAKNKNIQLSIPFFIPSLQIGSFGAITRITGVVKSRDDLAQFASSGPLAGFAFSLILLVISLLLPISQDQAIVVESSVFHDSILVGTIAKLIYGDGLREGATLYLHPLVLAAWSALLLNAINTIPVGEVDGGRIALALWGRKWGNRLNAISLGLLGLSGILNDIALFWVVFVVFLQRGPVAPLANEISPPSKTSLTLGLTALFLGLATCFPLLVPFS